jgi:hypothetical protein
MVSRRDFLKLTVAAGATIYQHSPSSHPHKLEPRLPYLDKLQFSDLVCRIFVIPTCYAVPGSTRMNQLFN